MTDFTSLQFRTATRDDLSEIVRMLADDPLGATRERFEDPLPMCYHRAFETIQEDSNNELLIAELEDRIVGVMQLTFIPTLTYQGGVRAQIEGVRVARSLRGRGVGSAFILWAIDRARDRHCHLVQLTTNRTRQGTTAFYEQLGFVASHEGLKLDLTAS